MAFQKKVFQEKIFQLIDEDLTGFSYNPFILSIVKRLFTDLRISLEEEGSTPQILNRFASEVEENPLFNIKNRGNFLAIEFKTRRASLVASLCEATLKSKGALVHRSENRIILCPHYNLPSEELSFWLNETLKIARETGFKFYAGETSLKS